MEQKQDKLWIRWIHTYYIKGQNIDIMNTPKQASWIFKKFFDARKWLTGTTSVHNEL